MTKSFMRLKRMINKCVWLKLKVMDPIHLGASMDFHPIPNVHVQLHRLLVVGLIGLYMYQTIVHRR